MSNSLSLLFTNPPLHSSSNRKKPAAVAAEAREVSDLK